MGANYIGATVGAMDTKTPTQVLYELCVRLFGPNGRPQFRTFKDSEHPFPVSEQPSSAKRPPDGFWSTVTLPGGITVQSSCICSRKKQAEHSASEVALKKVRICSIFQHFSIPTPGSILCDVFTLRQRCQEKTGTFFFVTSRYGKASGVLNSPLLLFPSAALS